MLVLIPNNDNKFYEAFIGSMDNKSAFSIVDIELERDEEEEGNFNGVMFDNGAPVMKWFHRTPKEMIVTLMKDRIYKAVLYEKNLGQENGKEDCRECEMCSEQGFDPSTNDYCKDCEKLINGKCQDDDCRDDTESDYGMTKCGNCTERIEREFYFYVGNGWICVKDEDQYVSFEKSSEDTWDLERIRC